MGKGIPAVILAAGASSRLGQPKALVEWNDETLVGRAVRLLEESGCSPIIVVTRSELLIDVAIASGGANVVVNQHPEEGRTGSLQVGLLALMGDSGRIPRRVFVVPVDRCGWQKETLETLLEGKTDSSPNPSGHPLLLFSVEDVLASGPDEPLRDIVRFSRIDAPGEHLNIDAPADLEALK